MDKESVKQSEKCLEDTMTEEIMEDTDKTNFMCIRVSTIYYI